MNVSHDDVCVLCVQVCCLIFSFCNISFLLCLFTLLVHSNGIGSLYLCGACYRVIIDGIRPFSFLRLIQFCISVYKLIKFCAFSIVTFNTSFLRYSSVVIGVVFTFLLVVVMMQSIYFTCIL